MPKILFLFALIPLVFADYNDKLSREKFFPLAAAAYNDNPKECIHNTFGKDAEVMIELESTT